MATFAQELKRARIEAGLTQQELADKAGVHRMYVSLLERGERSPTLDVLFRLCKALEIRPSNFIKRIE